MFIYSIKRAHEVAVPQRRLRNVQKNVMHVQNFLFCWSEPAVWHEIFAGVYFGGLAIFCDLRELIFAIFRKYPVPSIDNIFVFIEYVQ